MMFNSLHMLIIVLGHLFMWFIHVLGGGKAILLLFVTSMCIAPFILHWKLCRVPKVTTVPHYNILDATPYLIGFVGKRHCIALICI
jgi:hypothetical protein